MTEKMPTISYDDLLERNGITYKKFSNDPFNGSVEGRIKGTFKNGLLDGYFEEYFENGQLKSTGTLRDNLKNGVFKEYNEDGLLKLKATYENDWIEGDFEEYFDNGQLESNGTFRIRQKHGIFESYYKNGQLESKVTFKDDQLDGDFEQYFENGQLKLKGIIKNNKMHGTFQEYNDKGEIIDRYGQRISVEQNLDKWGNNIKKKEHYGPEKTTLIRPGKVEESVEEKKSDHEVSKSYDESARESIKTKEAMVSAGKITLKDKYFSENIGDDFYSGRTYTVKPMSFPNAVTECMTKYATFSGRASRSEFWWFYLFVTLMSWGSNVASASMFSPRDPLADILPLIVSLAFAVPSFSANCRRLHDIGKSGWWQLIAFTIIGIIPLVIWYATNTKTKGDKFNT